jgi:hypothetical protein
VKIKLVSFVTVTQIEERVARRWIRGAGANAEFEPKSEGFYAKFAEWPSSAYVGAENPGLEVGDKVKFTMEKVR